ncbi:MAG: type II toxin-antitoxin system death-on-curing family toxin [Pseudomonadota bacterium]
MTTPVWVPLQAVFVIHDRQIARHGGAPGIRDRGLIEAGWMRAENLAHYGEPSIYDLAAAYAFGLAKAHGFIDGNKRTAFVVAFAFLRLNGFAFRPDPAEGVRMIEDLARDAVSEAEFAGWLQAGAVKKKQR